MILNNYQPEELIKRINRLDGLVGDSILQSLCVMVIDKGNYFSLKLVHETLEAYEQIHQESLNCSAA